MKGAGGNGRDGIGMVRNVRIGFSPLGPSLFKNTDSLRNVDLTFGCYTKYLGRIDAIFSGNF